MWSWHSNQQFKVIYIFHCKRSHEQQSSIYPVHKKTAFFRDFQCRCILSVIEGQVQVKRNRIRQKGFGEIGFGKLGFGKTGFGKTGFGEIGFGVE